MYFAHSNEIYFIAPQDGGQHVWFVRFKDISVELFIYHKALVCK